MSASICIVYVLELCCAKKNIVLYFCNWQISQTWSGRRSGPMPKATASGAAKKNAKKKTTARTTEGPSTTTDGASAAAMAPVSSTPSLTMELLAAGDAKCTAAIIDTLAAVPAFITFAAKETEQTLERDRQDAEKLSAGIAQAVSRGVLRANPPVEPLTKIDVLGKSVEQVCQGILDTLGDAPNQGCVLVLSGLSGTGKGTTTAALQATLPKCAVWSNGNVSPPQHASTLRHTYPSGRTQSGPTPPAARRSSARSPTSLSSTARRRRWRSPLRCSSRWC